MIVLSHRGLWLDEKEKNRASAFHRSFNAGFGTETDLRDCMGRLVISHDMPKGDELSLDDFLDILSGRNLFLAINIKADGLAYPLKKIMEARHALRWFTFDMSIPETITQLRLGLPVFTRASEFELPPPCYSQAKGVWLDDFGANWCRASDIRGFLNDGKQVCIVSHELHGRSSRDLWQAIRQDGLATAPGLMICTDLPESASEFFGVGP